MTLRLDGGTRPDGLEVKATGPHVLIGDYRVSLGDFLVMVEYVLGNTDLDPGDPRRVFLERIRSTEVVSGWNEGRERIRVAAGALRYDADWKPSEVTEQFARISGATWLEELSKEARAAGAARFRVTADGFTQLPPAMVSEMVGPEGGQLWFLRHGDHWEAWPKDQLEIALRGSDEEPEGSE